MAFHSLNQIGVLKVMKQCVYLNGQYSTQFFTHIPHVQLGRNTLYFHIRTVFLRAHGRINLIAVLVKLRVLVGLSLQMGMR